ncbi:MAG: o-succinylbenzoate synthase [Salinivirgaceae bacterium]|nr:o-succinylbenzoate synthase [Salinivirgaceae bacterium]
MPIDIIPYTLHFKQPAGTSRGVYTEHKVWYLKMHDNSGRTGWGEVAPLPKLSCDDVPDFESVMHDVCKNFNGTIDYERLRNYPSILFGLECAQIGYNQFNNVDWKTSFALGTEGIPINGLVWMGSFEEMSARIEEKLRLGFSCIKIKIGAIDFEKEVALIEKIRNRFPADVITIRVDANGGFKPADAPQKLERLSKFGIHSIEQPIMARQWRAMADLCRNTPIPIALDEELIGVNETDQKINLLDEIRPQYIILKPSLHGGLSGCNEWIRLARERGIGFWATSALESNIGLLYIAMWAATLGVGIPQGLGTGALYTNNIDLPLQVVGEKLWYKSIDNYDFSQFFTGLE